MEPHDISENSSRILESQEIDDNEHNVIKGDTVGETLYSAKWILRILISLSKVYEDGWNDSLENDLCTLWDMTVEKDIVEFLIENDFFKMAEFTIKSVKEPRLTEIMIGIIGNMCCNEKSLDLLGNTNELVSIILSLIYSDDKETIIQVLRILRAAIWHIEINCESVWLKKIKEYDLLAEAVYFILKSSTSDELLTYTIDFVNVISDLETENCNNFFENIFNIDELVIALCESLTELMNQSNNSHIEIQFKNIENWFNIIFNTIKKELLRFADTDSDEKFLKINAVLLRILQPYENLVNFSPLEEKCLLCIQNCIKMIFSFQKNEMLPDLQLIKIILNIMINLKIVKSENEFGEDDIKQLQDYVINYWIETLKFMNREQIIEILRLCDYETVKSIIEITKSISGISEKYCIELSEVKDYF